MRVKKFFLGLLIISLLLISLLLLTSCGKKAECSKNSDCTTGNSCITSKCSEGKCVNAAVPNCCGNGKCDNLSGENKCICPADCGKCTGNVKYTVTTSRGPKQMNASYAIYLCDNNACVVGVDPDIVKQKSLTNNINEYGGFKAEVLTTIDYPYDVKKDKASVRILLKDIDPDVVGSIIFRRIQVLDGSELMGEQIISQELINVGDMFTEDLSLASSQSLVETEKAIDVNVDYEYTAMERGSPVIHRNSAKSRLSEKIMFVS